MVAREITFFTILDTYYLRIFKSLGRLGMAGHFLHMLNLCRLTTIRHLHYNSLNVIVCAETPLAKMGSPIS